MFWVRMFAMKKNLVLAMLMMLLCVSAFCAESSVRTGLPSLASSPQLPLDSMIGQVTSPDASDEHALLYRALSQEFSFEWTETYIREDVRAAIVDLFGPWLSSVLPASDLLMSVSHKNADGSIGLNVRVGESCMSFVLLDGLIVSMKEL